MWRYRLLSAQALKHFLSAVSLAAAVAFWL